MNLPNNVPQPTTLLQCAGTALFIGSVILHRLIPGKPSEKHLLSESLLSEGFPESLRRSSFPQKVSSPKGFQKAFGEAASLRKSPLRRVSRKPSEKQLPSESLLSEGFPESPPISRASRTSRPDGKHTRNDGRSKTWTRSARPPQIAHVILFDSLYKTQGTPVVPFRLFFNFGVSL